MELKPLPVPRTKRYDNINKVWHIYYDDPFRFYEVQIRNQISEIRNMYFEKLEDIAPAIKALGVEDFRMGDKKASHRWHKWTTPVSVHYHFSNSSQLLDGFGVGGVLCNVSIGGSAWAHGQGIAYSNLKLIRVDEKQ